MKHKLLISLLKNDSDSIGAELYGYDQVMIDVVQAIADVGEKQFDLEALPDQIYDIIAQHFVGEK